MQQQHPLDLPEIRRLVGPHLTLDSLCCCVRVNREWHDSFTPFLWSTFYYGHNKNPPKLPSEATLQRHAHFIKTFVISTLGTLRQLDELKKAPLTQLQALHFCARSDKPIGLGGQYSDFTWIFRQNSGLRVVDYDGHCVWLRGCLEGILGVVLSCPALTDLAARNVDFQEKHWESLRHLCATRLQRMVLHQTLFSINADWNDIPMPHLQELSITTTEIGGTSPGAGLIVQCPNLRILRWSAPASLEPGCFKEIVKACPRLEVIELQRMALPDDVIAMILDSMKASVTEVIITGEEHVASGTDLGFSIEAFRSLERRHFSTLVVLDVGPENFRVDSASLLQVLYSCPNLRQLRACRIWAEDINDGHQQQQQQQQRRRGNWACRGLEVFEVKISVSLGPLVSSIHEAVFCQFAALPRLRVLHIGGRARYKLKRHQLCIKEGGGLSLRLEHGMGHVAGLARLESVSVGRFAQELRREDVNWMKRYWVGLRALQGELHPRREVSEAIRKALTDPREDMKTMLDRLGFS